MWVVKEYDDYGCVIGTTKIPGFLAYFINRKANKGYLSRIKPNDMGKKNRWLIYVDDK